MYDHLFHIFRNTPLGRETLMQSIYFCRRIGVGLTIYIPRAVRFMMYFAQDAVQVDLDASYLTDPETARQRARDLAADEGLAPRFIEPKHHTATDLPDIDPLFGFMCCPRSISDLTSKIGLGYIGPKVRRIVRSSDFPVLMPSPVYKPWKSIAVLFGGSDSSLNALRTGLEMAARSGFPLDLFIQLERGDGYYDERIEDAGLAPKLARHGRRQHRFTDGDFAANLYAVPHDALVISGAYGHGLVQNVLFGSKVEITQNTLPNNMLVTGPQCAVRFN